MNGKDSDGEPADISAAISQDVSQDSATEELIDILDSDDGQDSKPHATPQEAGVILQQQKANNAGAPKKRKRKRRVDDDGNGAVAASAKKSRGASYSETEILYMCKAWASRGGDAVIGTSQSCDEMWKEVHNTYKQLIKHHAAHHLKQGKTVAYEERTAKKLKDAWSKKIQPALQKFAGIVFNSDPSGVNEESKFLDDRMDDYKEQVHQSGNNKLPKTFDKLLPAYLFIRNEPKFAGKMNPKTGQFDHYSKSKFVDIDDVDEKDDPRRKRRNHQGPGRDKTKMLKSVEAASKRAVAVVNDRISENEEKRAAGFEFMEKSMNQIIGIQQQQLKLSMMASAPEEEKQSFYSMMRDVEMKKMELEKSKLELELKQVQLKNLECEKKMKESAQTTEEAGKRMAADREEEDADYYETISSNDPQYRYNYNAQPAHVDPDAQVAIAEEDEYFESNAEYIGLENDVVDLDLRRKAIRAQSMSLNARYLRWRWEQLTDVGEHYRLQNAIKHELWNRDHSGRDGDAFNTNLIVE